MNKVFNILIVCGHYANAHHANSICVQNIAEEFVIEGHNVWVVANQDSKDEPLEETKNGVVIKRIPEKLTDRFDKWLLKKKYGNILYHIYHAIRYTYTFFLYPNVSPLRSRKVYKQSVNLIKRHRVDTVLATYRPYESIHSIINIKLLYGSSIRAITYHLDLMDSPNNKSSIIVNIKKKNKKAIANEINIVDRILLPHTASTIASKKIKYVDFPMYIRKGNSIVQDVSIYDNSFLNISYVGSLDINNRNPSTAIKLLNNIGKINGKDILLHIWGKLSDKETISLINSIDTNKIIYHGTVEPERVNSILLQSDFLLNVCNKVTYEMIPSKIFQYFAAEKPIINFVGNKNDRSLPYFKKYGYSLEIYADSEVSDNIKLMEEFLVKMYNIKIYTTPKLFMDCTPEYICKECLC